MTADYDKSGAEFARFVADRIETKQDALTSRTIFSYLRSRERSRMRLWMRALRNRRPDGRLVFFCLAVCLQHASPAAAENPASATKAAIVPSSKLIVGTQVVLTMSETFLHDQGRPISSQDQLIFVVERIEPDRIAVVSLDNSVRGWVGRDQVVSLDQADAHFSQVVANDPRRCRAPSGFTLDYCITAATPTVRSRT